MDTTGNDECLGCAYAVGYMQSYRYVNTYLRLSLTSASHQRPVADSSSVVWSDRHSPINPGHLRGTAEQELLALSPEVPTTVLNLSGLWGGARAMKHYVGRVAPTKEVLKSKVRVHGLRTIYQIEPRSAYRGVYI